jgi:hypothetical protein
MAGRIAYYGGIVKDGLILDLDAAKRDSYPSSGTVWNDISGFQNNGTLINGPTFNSSNGGSIVFDGVDDFTDLVFLPQQTDSPLSVFAWVYLNALPNPGVICGIWGHYGTSSVNSHFEMYNTYSRIRLGNINNTTLPVFTIGQWIHAGFTSTGTDHIYYVNGISQTSWSGATGAILGNPPTPYHMVGRSDVGRTWNGKISNICVYNRALSSNEITQNFNAQKGRFGL